MGLPEERLGLAMKNLLVGVGRDCIKGHSSHLIVPPIPVLFKAKF